VHVSSHELSISILTLLGKSEGFSTSSHSRQLHHHPVSAVISKLNICMAYGIDLP